MGLSMENGGLSVADALALQNNGRMGMFGDGNDFWVFFLFILLLGGNGGWGFGPNGVNGYMNQVNNDFLYTNLNNSIDRGFMQVANQNMNIERDICDTNQNMQRGFYNQEIALCNGFGQTQREIMENRFASQQCCCETNRNIDAVRYENSKNTCDLATAIHAEGEATRALINQNTMQELRDKLADRDRDLMAANFQISQVAQTNALVDRIKPCAIPAYITCSPYTSINNGCGCGY